MKKNVSILDLRPTQMSLGLLEVEDKMKCLNKMKPQKLKKEIAQNPFEVIVGPNGCLYLVDGHHRAFTYVCLNIKKAPAKFLHVFPKKTKVKDFWKKMIEKNGLIRSINMDKDLLILSMSHKMFEA